MNVRPVCNWQGGARGKRREAHSKAYGYGNTSAGSKPAARWGPFKGTNRETWRLVESLSAGERAGVRRERRASRFGRCSNEMGLNRLLQREVKLRME